MRVLAVLLLPLIAGDVYAQEREDVTARMVTQHVYVRTPMLPCDVAYKAAAIAQLTGIPAGIELLPGCQSEKPVGAPTPPTLDLLGMTVVDALNKLVELDPRYYWTESDGVIVVRPLEAWTDKKHFLHETIETLALKEVNAGEAFDHVMNALDSRKGAGIGPRIFDGDKPLSIQVSAISIVEALDAIVRAHGRLHWEVKYCIAERSLPVATISIRRFTEFNTDLGIGRRFPRRVDANGKPYDPCVPAK